MKYLSACLLAIILVIFSYSSVESAIDSSPSATVDDGQVEEVLLHTIPIRMLPGDNLYFLITLKEKYTRFFRPSAAKRAEFDFILSEKRLKESYLLLNNGKNAKGISNLKRYQSRLSKMTFQLDKARSQNQDIAKQVELISNGFRNQEIFLLSINQDFIINIGYKDSVKSFSMAVKYVDTLLPGLKNRFKIIKDGNTDDEESDDEDEFILESNPEAKPIRIIL